MSLPWRARLAEQNQRYDGPPAGGDLSTIDPADADCWLLACVIGQALRAVTGSGELRGSPPFDSKAAGKQPGIVGR
jgi:hypothetical protein